MFRMPIENNSFLELEQSIPMSTVSWSVSVRREGVGGKVLLSVKLPEHRPGSRHSAELARPT